MLYEDGTFNDLETIVTETLDGLKPHVGEFDSIAVTGISGVVVGAPVSILIDKPLIIVRKDEYSHSYNRVENIKNVGARYLFLDDFRGTGATQNRVLKEIRRLNEYAEMVAFYTYLHSGRDAMGYHIMIGGD
jgi:adenine/guanine phosphoribosyltransferase-like PRPP-binding protein